MAEQKKPTVTKRVNDLEEAMKIVLEIMQKDLRDKIKTGRYLGAERAQRNRKDQVKALLEKYN